MGDADYKTRKRAEWIAAGRCRGCGREKAPDATWCARCQAKYDRRLMDRQREDNRNKPRVDGNWIYY